MNMVWVACGKSRWGCERREDQNGSKKKEHLCGKQSGKWTGNEESARPGVKSSISGNGRPGIRERPELQRHMAKPVTGQCGSWQALHTL